MSRASLRIVETDADGTTWIQFAIWRQRWEQDGASADTVTEGRRHWLDKWHVYDVSQDRAVEFASRADALAYADRAIAAARTPACELARVKFRTVALPDCKTYWPKFL